VSDLRDRAPYGVQVCCGPQF